MGSSWTTAVLNGIPPFTEQFHPSCHCVIWQSSITTCFSQSLKTGLCTTTLGNFNFYPGALVLFRKHVVRALELGFYTSRRCTMQLNQTQPSPLTVLLQLNFRYQVQMTVVSPDAHPSSYSSVATTLYPTLVLPIIRWPGFAIITPSFPPFSAVFCNQRFHNCSSTMNVAFVKLSSSSRWIWNSAVTLDAVLLWFTDTISFNVRRSLSLSFCFQPPFLLVDDVLPWFVSVIIPLETAALDTPNKVAVLVTDAPPNFASTIWPLWKS